MEERFDFSDNDGVRKEGQGRDAETEAIYKEALSSMEDSEESFLHKKKMPLHSPEDVFELFGHATSTLRHIEELVVLFDDINPNTFTSSVIADAYGYVTAVIANIGKRGVFFPKEPALDFVTPDIPEHILGSQEVRFLQDRYLRVAERLMSGGYGRRYADYYLGTKKVTALYAHGLDLDKSPLGICTIGETEVRTDEHTAPIVFPIWLIEPQPQDDWVTYTPPVYHPLHGISLRFRTNTMYLDTPRNINFSYPHITAYFVDTFDIEAEESDTAELEGREAFEYVEIRANGMPALNEHGKELFMHEIMPAFRKDFDSFELIAEEGYIPAHYGVREDKGYDIKNIFLKIPLR
jgi:hypothetical protein